MLLIGWCLRHHVGRSRASQSTALRGGVALLEDPVDRLGETGFIHVEPPWPKGPESGISICAALRKVVIPRIDAERREASSCDQTSPIKERSLCPHSKFIRETRGFERARWLLSLVCAAGVAGCAQGAGTLPAGGPSSAHAASGLKHARHAVAPAIYAFEGSPDGSTPYAGLIDVGGTLTG